MHKIGCQAIFGKFTYMALYRYRLFSNIESKSSHNTYLNIIELLFFIYIFSNLKIIQSENLLITSTLEN